MSAESVAGPQLAVARFVEKAAGARAVHMARCEPMPRGSSQRSFAVDARIEGGPHEGAHRWVVRGHAPSAADWGHTCAHEFALLSTAHAARVKCPRPLWLCDEPGIRAFFVMDRVEGIAAGDRLVNDDSLVPDRPGLAAELGENLARVHLVPASVPALAFLGDPPQKPPVERIAAYRCALEVLRVAGTLPVLDHGLRWCERNPPPPSSPALVHRQYHTGNYLVHEGHLAAMLDWECAGWGDPLEDLGAFLASCRRFGRLDREAGGIGPAHDFLAGYHRIRGRSVAYGETLFWQVMAHIRWAVVALQQGASGAQVMSRLEPEILSLTGAVA